MGFLRKRHFLYYPRNVKITAIDLSPRMLERARIWARIGGLHGSLCTGTIEKALGSRPGVDKVSVSLTHEQALVEYDPNVTRPEELLQILRDMGYTISDPRKVRPFEEEEQDLVREGKRFLVAIALSLITIALNADPSGLWPMALSAVVFASLIARLFLVLRRSHGLGRAIGGAAILSAGAAGLLLFQRQGGLTEATPFILGGMAIILVCGDVKRKAEAKIAEIEAKIRSLQRMKAALTRLAGQCRGERPTSQCPILEALNKASPSDGMGPPVIRK